MTAADPARFKASILQFIRIELETGMTYASVALTSHSNEKRQRNKQNARKAHDTAQRFLGELVAGERTGQPDLIAGLIQLKSLLTGLGEKFEE